MLSDAFYGRVVFMSLIREAQPRRRLPNRNEIGNIRFNLDLEKSHQKVAIQPQLPFIPLHLRGEKKTVKFNFPVVGTVPLDVTPKADIGKQDAKPRSVFFYVRRALLSLVLAAVVILVVVSLLLIVTDGS